MPCPRNVTIYHAIIRKHPSNKRMYNYIYRISHYRRDDLAERQILVTGEYVRHVVMFFFRSVYTNNLMFLLSFRSRFTLCRNLPPASTFSRYLYEPFYFFCRVRQLHHLRRRHLYPITSSNCIRNEFIIESCLTSRSGAFRSV